MTLPAAGRPRTTEAKILARLRKLETAVARGQRTPQLVRSAIDDGAVTVTAEGSFTGSIGVQYDGTTALVTANGPVPPTPLPPTVISVVGGIRVAAGGGFVDPQPGWSSPVVAPSNFARWDVEVSADATFPEFADPAAPNSGSILPASGGQVKVGWPVGNAAVYVRLRTRATDGKRSAPSDAVIAYTGNIGLGDLGFDLSKYVASDTIFYSATQPAAGQPIGTLWVKESTTGGVVSYETRRWDGAQWLLAQDQGITGALVAAAAAQSAADTKAKVFYSNAAPTWTGPAGSALWFDSDDGNRPWRWDGAAWTDLRLGNGAITPGSLVASSIIATGTIDAALLSAILVLTTALIAGDPLGYHARLDQTGLRTFRPDPDDPLSPPQEAIRLGTSTSDAFALTDQQNRVVASINDVGGFSGTDADFDALTVGGTTLPDLMDTGVGRIIGWFSEAVAFSGVVSEYGICEIPVFLTAGRRYELNWKTAWAATVKDTVATFRVRSSIAGAGTPDTAPAVTIADTTQGRWDRPSAPTDGNYLVDNGLVPYDALTTSLHRFGLSIGRDAGTGTISLSDARTVDFWIKDLGPTPGTSGSISNMGGSVGGGPAGTPTAGKTTYVKTLAPAGWASYTGGGNLMDWTNDVYQGYYGGNGDQKGYWWFSLPSITGTVLKVEVYLYAEHWYFNSGGTALISVTNATGTSTPNFTKLQGNTASTRWPKPGGRWVTLPSQTNVLFKNSASPRARAITVGPGGTTNQLYYGRFSGASARLRLTYTQ